VPVGYRNVDGPNGKRILVPDVDPAQVITDLFEHFRTGKYSTKSLAAQFRLEDPQVGFESDFIIDTNVNS
jgi:site-specific DNA recombinase